MKEMPVLKKRKHHFNERRREVCMLYLGRQFFVLFHMKKQQSPKPLRNVNLLAPSSGTCVLADQLLGESSALTWFSFWRQGTWRTRTWTSVRFYWVETSKANPFLINQINPPWALRQPQLKSPAYLLYKHNTKTNSINFPKNPFFFFFLLWKLPFSFEIISVGPWSSHVQ